jgi:hypothetical protein
MTVGLHSPSQCSRRAAPDAPHFAQLRTGAARSNAVGALALGAVAAGAFAVGALAIGALALGRVAVGRARIGRLEIDELSVRRLRVTEELSVPRSLQDQALVHPPATSVSRPRTSA